MRTASTTHLLLVAGHLIASAAAGNLFEGCYTAVSTGTRTTTQTSVDDCVNNCNTAPTTYAAGFRASDGTCSCFNSGGATNYFTQGDIRQCGANYELRYLATETLNFGSYDFVGCRSNVQATRTSAGGNFQGCMNACKNYEAAEVTVYRADGSTASPSLQCRCLQSITSMGDSIQCGIANAISARSFIYTPKSAPALTRRRAREARQMEDSNEDVDSVCPSGLTACLVKDGDAGSFECLDTSSELESCGGCLYGQYGWNVGSNMTIGSDCTALDVDLGAITCYNGQCISTV